VLLNFSVYDNTIFGIPLLFSYKLVRLPACFSKCEYNDIKTTLSTVVKYSEGKLEKNAGMDLGGRGF
jgi:hypothetical protein